MTVNYEAVWQVLADLITELRKKGETVPTHVMEDLRSAKTTIHILKVDEDNPDHLLRVEEFLGKVESYVMYTAQRKFGALTVNVWMDRLERAKRKVHEDIQPASKFIPGIPRDKHWVRIKIADDVPLERIELAAEEGGLEHKTQKNGYVIVYGEKTRIQNFIKRMAEFQQESDISLNDNG